MNGYCSSRKSLYQPNLSHLHLLHILQFIRKIALTTASLFSPLRSPPGLSQFHPRHDSVKPTTSVYYQTAMSNDETVIPPHKAAMSYESWTRVPSTADVLFQLELPYTSPKSALGRCLWRWRVWFEITFALSMLQPWEKVVIMLMLHISLMFFMSTAYYYLPSHFAIIKTRTLYYLLGQEAADAGMHQWCFVFRNGLYWGVVISSPLGIHQKSHCFIPLTTPPSSFPTIFTLDPSSYPGSRRLTDFRLIMYDSEACPCIADHNGSVV
ncbi:hypothetical protein ABKN59_006507 [Abortiporus biennis]